MSNELDSDILYAVVKKLTGPIDPVGSSHVDVVRKINLKLMIELTGMLIDDIACVARENEERHESSMKDAGGYAREFMDEYCENYR